MPFSDGVPFTSADVLFSARVAYDPKVASVLASSLEVRGQAAAVRRARPHTVVVTLPSAFAPGLRLLDNLPILPKHQLEAALRQRGASRTRGAWPRRPGRRWRDSGRSC